jgi:hypothetical protein
MAEQGPVAADTFQIDCFQQRRPPTG